MSDYYCPNCYSDLGDQPGFDPSEGTWTCKECGSFLMDEDIDSGYRFSGVAWRCDSCNALLNRQSGFSDIYDSWMCTKCGYTTSISSDDIIEEEHTCPNCSANLKKQWGYNEFVQNFTCTECYAKLHRQYYSSLFDVVEDKHICPSCGAILLGQSNYYEYDEDYTCSECDTKLHRDYSFEPFSVVEERDICPNCGESLLSQSEYSDCLTDYTCSECYADLHRDNTYDQFSISGKANYSYHVSTDDGRRYSDDYEYESIREKQHREEIERLAMEQMRREEEQKRREQEFQNWIQEQERIEREEAQRKREQRRERIHYFKEKIILFLSIVFRKKIEIPMSSELAKGRKCTEVYQEFVSAGFLRVKYQPIDDLRGNTISYDLTVQGVSINKNTTFSELDRACITDKVVICYHTIHTEKVPITSRMAKNKDLDEVRKLFIDSGFENVISIPMCDLRPWQMKRKNRKVAAITIDGFQEYRRRSKVRINAEIKIKYHCPK